MILFDPDNNPVREAEDVLFSLFFFLAIDTAIQIYRA